MRILFLDIDGVLNSEQSTIMYWRNNNRKQIFINENHFCPIAIANLQYLMEEISDLHIVISSTWRKHFSISKLKRIFQDKVGIDSFKIIGKTPDLKLPKFSAPEPDRGLEIQEWLDKNIELPIKDFIIIDDNIWNMAHFKDTPNLIQTDEDLGLTIKDVRKILKHFKVNTKE